MEEEVDAGLHKANLLDVETDKCRTAEPGGGQQQQSPVAQRSSNFSPAVKPRETQIRSPRDNGRLARKAAGGDLPVAFRLFICARRR